MPISSTSAAAATFAWALFAALTWGSAGAEGIYSCTDSKGRKLTADRPIAECADRVQLEHTRTGTIKRTIGPSLTADERAAQEQKDKAEAEARAQVAEEKRRDRALLVRYPSRAAHDQERNAALAQVDEGIKASNLRTADLAEQRKAIRNEQEFYLKDPSKAPDVLKRRAAENSERLAQQTTFVAEQQQEKQRINQRFDDELVKLKQLWTSLGQPTEAKSAPAKSAAGMANTSGPAASAAPLPAKP